MSMSISVYIYLYISCLLFTATMFSFVAFDFVVTMQTTVNTSTIKHELNSL